MSRSRKKPYCSPNKAGVMKAWKKEMSRKLRRMGLEEYLDPRLHGSSWTAPNDGKYYDKNVSKAKRK